MKKILIFAFLLLRGIYAPCQNCDVDFPGTSTRYFSIECGGTSSNLTLGKTTYMGDGDSFTFDVSVNIDGNVSVNAQGNARIIIPSGVTVNIDGNFLLDRKNPGCSSANPCIFEIVVNGTINISKNLHNHLVKLVWSGSGTVTVDDHFDNTSNGCMECGSGGCPSFGSDLDCKDNGVGCSGGDFCAAISNPCSSDSVKPIINGCSNIVANITGTGCSQAVSWAPPTATDNCAVSSLTSTHSSGSVFNQGTTTVTYTARDPSGNSATCSFTVTVRDATPPIFVSCGSNPVITSYDPILQTGVATWDTPQVTDNCGMLSLTNSASPGSHFPKGITVVTYTAADGAGNIVICDFEVNISGNNPEAQLQVYKALSPNGDGFNDSWQIKGIEKYPKNKVTIFDRWGSQIYSVEGYNNETVVWGGMRGGKPVPAGTYFYAIELNDGTAVRKGPLELIN